MSVLTVSQLNRYISFTLKEDKKLRGALICGEISNLNLHTKTGHIFFTLKDAESAVKAVMFSGAAARLNFEPRQGMSVIISADVRVYERDGVYQLYVNDMQPDGLGALYLACEQLKQKLLYEGLFDEERKKPLPSYPEKIGIVTSADGAALQDILNISSRRYPLAEAVVFPCLVQGAGAPESICAALDAADESGLDIIIVGRGGGSFEDLAAFNSEALARRIAAVKTPVISAVGHETDVTISDLTADLRAPTPSSAAELALPDIGILYGGLHALERRLKQSITACIASKAHVIAAKEKQLNYLISAQKKLAEGQEKLTAELEIVKTEKEKLALEQCAEIFKNGERISSAKSLKKGDLLTVKFPDGEIQAAVL
ncbi:MAG: exodeoxyribonuclease VII large subunit [Oscillospiraceae bacterium]|nr:exodeoxyribonuclease VII large subunit [Oscillospiraceae bacterium]